MVYTSTGRTTGIPLAVFAYRHSAERNGISRIKLFPDFSRDKQVHFSSVTLSDRTLSLTFQSLTDDQAMRLGVEPGDVIRDASTGMVFFIRARTGTTVTAEAQNNYVSDGSGGFDTLTPFSTTSGTLQFLNSRLYAPSSTTLADFTQGSAVATNAGRFDGFAAFLDADIVPGDFLFADQDPDFVFANGEAEVVSIDTAAGTINFAGNARNGSVDKVLPLWIRQPPPNA